MGNDQVSGWKFFGIAALVGLAIWLLLTKPWEKVEVVQRCAYCPFECKETGMMQMHLRTEHGCEMASKPTVTYERIDRERLKMVQTWRCK